MKVSTRRNPGKPKIEEPYTATSRRYGWLVPGAIFFLTIAAFYPVLGNDFVNWDDTRNIVENPFYRGVGQTNLRWMFTTFHMGHYQPLSWLTLGIDYLIWGVNPLGYHLTNLLLHCANAGVLYFIVSRLFLLGDFGSAVPGRYPIALAAGFSALMFSLHPLRVESVAWATERRDVLSGLFILLTIFCYLEAVKIGESRSGRRPWMAISLGFYGLSLLSKAGGMTLPLVLLVLDVYPLRRLGHRSTGWFGPEARRVWQEKVPFLLLGVATGIVALMAQYQSRAIRPLDQHSIASRLTQSLYGLVFYLWKTILPFSLSPLYEIPEGADPWRWPFLVSGFTVLGISMALFLLKRYWPAVLASWISYVVIAAPTLGIAQSGPQLVADRYSYLSCLAWAILAGWGIVYLWKLRLSGRITSWLLVPLTGIAAMVLVGFGVLTWKQTQIWKDSETLWRHALSIQKRSTYAHNNLGNALVEQDRLDEAIEEFREVMRINPQDADAHYNLGNVLARQGKFAKAVDRFQEALRIYPGYADVHYDLGNALARQGNLGEAVVHFRQAIHFAPQDARAHYNLGHILSRQGKLAEAVDHLRQAVRVDPNHVKAHYYLALTQADQGDFEGAIKEFQEVLRIDPSLAEVHAGLARVLVAQGRKDEAVRHYQESLRLLKSHSQTPSNSREPQ